MNRSSGKIGVEAFIVACASACCKYCLSNSGALLPLHVRRTASKASPEHLLDLNCGHWSVENLTHYVRDITFGEDRSRLRTGNAPQILTAFRNLAVPLIPICDQNGKVSPGSCTRLPVQRLYHGERIDMIHRFGSSRIKATRRHFASCPQQALALPGFPKGGQQSFTSPAPCVPCSTAALTCVSLQFLAGAPGSLA